MGHGATCNGQNRRRDTNDLKPKRVCRFVQQVLFDREQSHYQLAYGKSANTLLIRVDTGAVEAIEVPELIELRDKVCAKLGLQAEGHKLQIFAVESPKG